MKSVISESRVQCRPENPVCKPLLPLHDIEQSVSVCHQHQRRFLIGSKMYNFDALKNLVLVLKWNQFSISISTPDAIMIFLNRENIEARDILKPLMVINCIAVQGIFSLAWHIQSGSSIFYIYIYIYIFYGYKYILWQFLVHQTLMRLKATDISELWLLMKTPSLWPLSIV